MNILLSNTPLSPPPPPSTISNTLYKLSKSKVKSNSSLCFTSCTATSHSKLQYVFSCQIVIRIIFPNSTTELFPRKDRPYTSTASTGKEGTTIPVNSTGHFNFPFCIFCLQLLSLLNDFFYNPGTSSLHPFISPLAGHCGRVDHVGHLLPAQVHLRPHGDRAERPGGHLRDDLCAQPPHLQLGSIRHDQLWLPLRHSAARHDRKLNVITRQAVVSE